VIADADTRLAALEEARERTLAIVAPFSAAELEAVHDPLMSPLVWDLAHIAAYEDLWLCHREGGLPLLHAELAEMYDAFETPRRVRGGLPLLDHAGALEYLAEGRERARGVLDRADGDIAELVLRHEHQHNETMLQAIELAVLATPPGMPRAARPPAPGGPALSGLERLTIPGGRCPIGAGPEGFAYDNERPRHQTDVREFRIGRVPITNASYLTFVEGGGSTSPGSRPRPSPRRTAPVSRRRSSGRRPPRGRRAPAPTSTTAALAAIPPARTPTAPPPTARSGCSGTSGNGRPPHSAATRASGPIRTASTPKCSSATRIASCAAVRGPPGATSPPRRFAIGTSRSGARSSPG
jgi:hypothetical protein